MSSQGCSPRGFAPDAWSVERLRKRGSTRFFPAGTNDYGLDVPAKTPFSKGQAPASVADSEAQLPGILARRGSISAISLVLKRFFDILFSLMAMAALSPLLLVIALAIRLDSSGTIFYAS